MSTPMICLRVSHLPDARASRNRLLAAAGGGAASGDVGGCVRRRFGELLRLLACFSPGPTGLRVRYIAEKVSDNKDPSLDIELHAWSEEAACLDALSACIQSGPLPKLYGFEPATPNVADCLARPGAVWDITRNEHAVAGILNLGDNPLASPHYYLCHPFVPCRGSRGDRIERALSNARDTVVIDLAVTPTDMASHLDASIRDLGRLQKINRPPTPSDSRDDPLAWLAPPPGNLPGNLSGSILGITPGHPPESSSGVSPEIPRGSAPENHPSVSPGVAGRGSHHPNGVSSPRTHRWPTHRPDRSSRLVEPMHRPDPVVDEVLRLRRRFHESLLRPHLTYHARVISRHPADACAVAAVLAEESFEDGSYRLVSSRTDDGYVERFTPDNDAPSVSPLPAATRLPSLAEHPLVGLGVVGTADELQGLFALPAATGRPTHGLGRDTDPPKRSLQELIVLGDETG